MDLALNLPPDGPRVVRLVEALREAILTGRLASGARLPASRVLAVELNVSRGTVVTAYDELVSQGYCIAHVGAGTYVAPLGDAPRLAVIERLDQHNGASSNANNQMPPRLSAWGGRLTRPGLETSDEAGVGYDFRSGSSPDVFPATMLARALRRTAVDLAGQVGPGRSAGSARLRQALVAHLGRVRGLQADPSQVIIVSGSQQGLDLAARLLLDPGDPVCMEEPGYPRARATFQSLGSELVPVPVDAGGIVTSRLPAFGARMVYVTPSHQFPTGAMLQPDRRLALLDWAERHDAWVLEDDYDSEFRYSGPPLPCLQGLDRSGRCLYLGTLSKLLHPALRLGYLVVPPPLVRPAIAAKTLLDQASTPIIQEALADLFEAGEIERHLRRALRSYRVRRAHLLAACARRLPAGVRVWPVGGGLHAFVEVEGVDQEILEHALTARGLALGSASDCYTGARPPGAQLILWFSRIPTEKIAPGIAALGEAIGAARRTA